MSMQRFFRLSATCALLISLLTGCLKEKNAEVITLAYSKMTFEAVDKPTTIDISANFLWNIEITDSWLNVSPIKGVGDERLTVTVAANPGIEERTASFFIVGEKVREEVKVIQKGEELVLEVPEGLVNVASEGGQVTLPISANVPLEYEVEQPWVRFAETKVETKVVSTKQYVFAVETNTTLEARTCKITFKQKGGAATATVSLSQAGETESIQLAQTEMTVPAKEATHSFGLKTNVPWSATTAESWIHLVSTKLVQEDQGTFTVEANPRVEARTGTITLFKEGSPNALKQTLTLTQEGAAPAIRLTPEAFEALPYNAAQTYTLKVNANCDWTLDSSETAAWLTRLKTNVQDSTVTFALEENVDVTARRTALVIRQKDGTYFKTVEVEQAASPQRISLNSEGSDLGHVPSAGATYQIKVTANVGWKATVDVPWIYVSPQTKGMETDILTLTVTENEEVSSRSARLTVANSEASATLDITQLPAKAAMLATPEKISVQGGLSRVQVTVRSNVAWDIVNLPAWITVHPLPRTKALTDSIIELEIAENTTDQPRSLKLLLRQKGGDASAYVDVDQAVALMEVNPMQVSVPARGQENLSVSVKANVAWEILSKPAWLIPVRTANNGARHDSLLVFKVGENPALEARTEEVVIRHRGGQVNTKFSLNQLAAQIKATAQSNIVPPTAGTFDVEVRANVPWTLGSCPAWLQRKGAQALQNGSLDSLLTFTVAENPEAASRSGVLTFVQYNGAAAAAVQVNQAQARIQVEKSLLNFRGAAGTQQVAVTADVDWKVLSEQPQWLTVTATEMGLTLQVTENAQTGSRSHQVVLGHANGLTVATLRVQQDQAEITAQPAIVSFQAQGGNQQIQVTADADWLVLSQPQWLQATRQNNLINLTVAANTGTGPREGSLVLALQSGVARDTVTLIQAGGFPYAQGTVSPAWVSNEGGTATVTVSSNVTLTYDLPVAWATETARKTEGATTTYTFTMGPTTEAAARQANLAFKDAATGQVLTTLRLGQSAPTVSRADSLVLVHFYNATNGSGWRDAYVWNLGNPVRTWKGVSLRSAIQDGAYRVSRLELSDARLAGQLPERLSELTYLEVLNLSKNTFLTGYLFNSWAKAFTYLNTLDLSDCSLVNAVLQGFSNIPAAWGPTQANPAPGTSPFRELVNFRLSGNQLTGTVPERLTWHPHFAQWQFEKNIAPQLAGPLALPAPPTPPTPDPEQEGAE